MKLRRFVSVLALLAGLSLTGLGLSGEAAAAGKPVNYVALGDSYSAASGVLPLDSSAPLECLRSSLNYPHVLAEKLGANLTDVTCGAAETSHFSESQYPGVAPQLDALGQDTDLVTMTIGGNDSGVFIGAIASCGSLGVVSLGQGSPCQDTFGSQFEDTIKGTTYPSLVEALKAVHEKAPKARVAILSYPWIMPETDGCYPQMPVAKGDVPYLRSLQRTLNDAVRRAAQETDSIFVNLNGVSNGHDACQAAGTRWIEPVLLGSNPVIVHPNALGESKMAEETLKVLAEDEGENSQPAGPPQTRIVKVRIKGKKRKATFRFRSSEPSSTFRCRLDRRAFRNCKNPKTYKHLKPGKHVFRVAAIDENGRVDPSPAVLRFRIRR
jgi:lysophospholipase L1-like esterase